MKSTWHHYEDKGYDQFLTIWVTSYFTSPPDQTHRAVSVWHEWDKNDYDALVEEMGISDDEEIIDTHLRKAFDFRFIHPHKYPNANPRPEQLYDADTGFEGNVYRIWSNPKSILQWLTKWIEDTKTDEHLGGGDDSYFDYDPDMIAVIFQVALALNPYVDGVRKLWDSFYKWLETESPYAPTRDFNYDSENVYDLLPKWE